MSTGRNLCPGRVIQDPDDVGEFLRCFGATEDSEFIAAWKPRYNLAPSEEAACVIERDGKREVVTLKWGFIPNWERDKAMAKKPINARSEKVSETRMLRDAFRERRCIVPLTGWYEWTPGKLRKQPHCIRPAANAPLGFAGIYDHWESDFGDVVDSFAIIICEPNAKMAKIHQRMGCILEPADYDAWLDPRTEVEALQPMLRPSPDDWLRHVPVSTKVSRASYKGADCVNPVQTLFGEA